MIRNKRVRISKWWKWIGVIKWYDYPKKEIHGGKRLTNVYMIKNSQCSIITILLNSVRITVLPVEPRRSVIICFNSTILTHRIVHNWRVPHFICFFSIKWKLICIKNQIFFPKFIWDKLVKIFFQIFIYFMYIDCILN